MARAVFAMGVSKLNLDTHAAGNTGPAIAMICSGAIADCDAADQGLIMIRFVRALAKRQARLDVGLSFDAANDNGPRTLH